MLRLFVVAIGCFQDSIEGIGGVGPKAGRDSPVPIVLCIFVITSSLIYTTAIVVLTPTELNKKQKKKQAIESE